MGDPVRPAIAPLPQDMTATFHYRPKSEAGDRWSAKIRLLVNLTVVVILGWYRHGRL